VKTLSKTHIVCKHEIMRVKHNENSESDCVLSSTFISYGKLHGYYDGYLLPRNILSLRIFNTGLLIRDS
jgi:hypothetical protein